MEIDASRVVGAKQCGKSSQFASTSSFGMSGANAHMVLAPNDDTVEETNKDFSQSLIWQCMRCFPNSRSLHLALKVHGIDRSGIEIYSTPFVGPLSSHLLQAKIYGHPMAHASMFLEAAFAASHMLDDSRLQGKLIKVGCFL